MSDILNQFKTLENSINVSSFGGLGGNKKIMIFSFIGALLFFPLFKPLYMYKKDMEKNKVEKAGRMITVYTEKYKLSIKKIVILYLIYVAVLFVLLKFVLRM